MKQHLAAIILLSAIVSATAFAQNNTVREPTLHGALTYKVQGNPDAKSVGQPEGTRGFKSLPATMLQLNERSSNLFVRHPICMTKGSANAGWLGIALIRGDKLSCMTHKGESALFWTLSSKPNQPITWMNASSASPEPRSTLVVATQHTPPRPLRPCISNNPTQAFAGYIGDDGRCYGKNSSNGQVSATSYMVPVTQARGAGAKPFQGWAPAAPGFIPHGAHKVTTPKMIGSVAVSGALATRMLCRANVGGLSWPGWVEGNSCKAFTYANNKTSSTTASTFAVFRTVAFNEDASPPYAFHSQGGKAFYACVAWGAGDRPLWGFTNNPSACTNGSQTSTKNVKLVRLPAEQGGRA